RTLPDAVLATLARAAGGRDRIPAFCLRLLADQAHPPRPRSDREHRNGKDDRGRRGDRPGRR
ncbi:hypothetical protein, partial [Actinocorallia lasiicapitis]